ncbi:MAG: hypothetical protein D6721_04325 [Gammaproteobacteria bacterium]|nr:MAG: hypothetical protein D6721_04325 [Gammaproteobacteria bacterium]
MFETGLRALHGHQPDAQRHGLLPSLPEVDRAAAQGAQDAARDRERALRPCPGEDDGEFLPAVAGQGIGTAQATPDSAHGFLEYPVARLVPVGIVDALEMVEVEQKQGQGPAMLARGLELGLQDLVEVAPVSRTGEGIGAGLDLEALGALLHLLGVLQAVQVAEHEQLPRLVRHRGEQAGIAQVHLHDLGEVEDLGREIRDQAQDLLVRHLEQILGLTGEGVDGSLAVGVPPGVRQRGGDMQDAGGRGLLRAQ